MYIKKFINIEACALWGALHFKALKQSRGSPP